MHILLKRVVAEIVKTIIQNGGQKAPKVQLKWVLWGILGRSVGGIVLFRMVLEGVCFSPGHFGVAGASQPDGDHRGANQIRPQSYRSVFSYD